MTAKNRADIQTEIAALLADNTAGDISPLDVRTVHETSKDSNMNLLDTAGTQTVLGSVNFTGTNLQRNGFDIARSPALRRLILAKSELPAPSSGVITLADGIEYVQGDSFSLGADRLVLGENTAYKGIESIIIALTYTGTGDMFTSVDKTIRVSSLSISCANGRVFNCSTASQKILRFNDISISSADEYALFTGVNMIIRMTNVSPSSLTTGGITFAGSFRSFLYEVSAVTINGGTLFDLSTATFDAFNINDALITLNAGTTGISGLASSGNINAGGIASIFNNRFNGAGTPLGTITVDDALWQFLSNDDIPDTRPDGLLSMQSNAVATTIDTQSVGVLAAGTWTVKRASQMTGTTAGRLTYDGGKDATLPITLSVTIEPVSGGSQVMGVLVARDGVADADSLRTGTASPGNPTSISVPWQDVFATAEFTEVFVTNESGTTNVLASSSIQRVN
jgi:hypothetical protein